MYAHHFIAVAKTDHDSGVFFPGDQSLAGTEEQSGEFAFGSRVVSCVEQILRATCGCAAPRAARPPLPQSTMYPFFALGCVQPSLSAGGAVPFLKTENA